MIPAWLRRALPSAILFAVLLAAWQLAVTVFRVREYILPGPLSVVRATFDFRILADVDASLNALAFVLICAGLAAVKRGNVELH